MDGALTRRVTGLANVRVFQVAVDPMNPETVYAHECIAGTVSAATRRLSAEIRGGVFRSSDGGASWRDIATGLANPSVNALAIDPQSAGSIYAGTGGGVFATTVRRFDLTVTRSGLGGGTANSSPHGITCGTDCSEPYWNGTVVTLTAVPAFGSFFIGRSGCDAAAGASCTLTMKAERAVTARFVGVPLMPGLR